MDGRKARLDRCVVSASAGYAVYVNQGSCDVNDCIIKDSNAGMAISANGFATIKKSDLRGNQHPIMALSKSSYELVDTLT